MQKIVFSLPKDQAEAVVKFLHSSGITNENISVVGHESLQLDDLPDPGEFDDDVVPAAMRGAGFGGATGLLLGLSAALVGPGIILGGAALALATAGGATFGVLASSLIGSSVPNSQIKEYEDALTRGEVLLIAEIDDERSEVIRVQALELFPDLNAQGRVNLLPPVV